MSHDKELIERLALEVEKNISFEHRAPLSDTSIITFATRLLAAYLAERGEEATPWIDGYPKHPWDKEWFIALTTYGDRVVLKALPEEYGYDFKTADDTYLMKDRVKAWMQFPDSEFKAPQQPAIPEGMTLVPIEPTEAMTRTAFKIDLSFMPGQEHADRAAIYKAMIAAAGVKP